MAEKIRTTVRIAGHDYTMSSYDPEAHVQRVARYVDRMINDLTLATKLPAQQVAVIAATSIADDLVKAKDEITRLKADVLRLNAELNDLRSGK